MAKKRVIRKKTEPRSLRVGGCFEGIGGFPLAAEVLGLEHMWWCEWEPPEKEGKPEPRQRNQELLARWFPNATGFGDIAEVAVDDLPDIDVLTGGTPCQGFSVAGKRAGLGDHRSGLFDHFIRLIDGLQERGLKWVVWENVPGALTSNKGEDFANVIAALVGADEPIRLPKHPNGRASRYSGVVDGPRGQLAWRVLDAQHFGVAQRRRRIIAVLHIGGRGAAEVLLEPQGRDGDPPTRDPQEPFVARLVGQGPEGSGGSEEEGGPQEGLVALVPEVNGTITTRLAGHYDSFQEAQSALIPLKRGFPDPAGPLTRRYHKGVNTTMDDGAMVVVGEQAGVDAYNGRITGELAHTVQAGNGRPSPHTIPTVVGVYRKVHRASSPEDAETWDEADTSNTLNLFDTGERDTHAVVEAIYNVYPVSASKEPNTLVAHPVDVAAALAETSVNRRSDRGDMIVNGYGVRRLTPTECERLQGFPSATSLDDSTGWTGGQPDSTRYRQLGNAVAVPVAGWILARIAAHEAGVEWRSLPGVRDVLLRMPWILLHLAPPMIADPEMRVELGGALAFDWQASGAKDTSWNGKARSWLVKMGDYAGSLSATKVQAVMTTASTVTASAGHHGHSSPRGDGTDNLAVHHVEEESRPTPERPGKRRIVRRRRARD